VEVWRFGGISQQNITMFFCVHGIEGHPKMPDFLPWYFGSPLFFVVDICTSIWQNVDF